MKDKVVSGFLGKPRGKVPSVELELHFYGEDGASSVLSVKLSTGEAGNMEKVLEIQLFALVATRLLYALKGRVEADRVSAMLSIDSSKLLSFFSDYTYTHIKLAEYPGYPAKLNIVARFTLSNPKRFFLQEYGFGLSGAKRNQHFSLSIIGLLQHLTARRKNDKEYINLLYATAFLVAGYHRQNCIGFLNQVTLARTAVATTCAHYDLSDV
jgi:hypothetical protein